MFLAKQCNFFVKNGFLVPSQGFFHFGGEFYFFKCEKIRTAPPGKKSGNEKNLFVPWDKKWVWKESFCSMGQKDFFHSHFFYRGVQFESFHTRESVFNKKILICKIFRLVFQKPVLQSRKGTFWSSGLNSTKYPFCFSVQASEKLCSNILQIYTNSDWWKLSLQDEKCKYKLFNAHFVRALARATNLCLKSFFPLWIAMI